MLRVGKRTHFCRKDYLLSILLSGALATLGSSMHVPQHKFDFFTTEINAPLSHWNTHADMFHDVVDDVECWKIM
jgi:hypothetical protein